MTGESTVLAFVEVPSGCQNKYEYDPELGGLRLDRVLYSPMHYPGEYGFIPETLAADGDPLDILVLSTAPTFPGCRVPARIVGVLDMADDKGEDTKILAVVDVDPRFAHVREIDDVPPHVKREIEHFFRVYKDLEGKTAEIRGWRGRQAALEEVAAARRAYAGR
ncbi:inorganic diphosphatase [Caldinitratiruptor microaerophilus]|uniref:Inorganic pyrophosphatase n=1 Tax=Caldinitratiruptor microaerophilus TaxID=671077 RepID=A0AA35CKC1_9FIRM|nr:inorganic diphosphatase [Caldinitratiruptor microaerophilus]BDG60712.1 inorganic pyrophosphatase [Caldinitratiruptor microaerophilus]